ncbi:hypothetical protein F183_A47000 [Bryobacterales bacterium F-183]|nr:hypothetical protein F183_A47000 [Bryobacterales bacterium F-183]
MLSPTDWVARLVDHHGSPVATPHAKEYNFLGFRIRRRHIPSQQTSEPTSYDAYDSAAIPELTPEFVENEPQSASLANLSNSLRLESADPAPMLAAPAPAYYDIPSINEELLTELDTQEAAPQTEALHTVSTIAFSYSEAQQRRQTQQLHAFAAAAASFGTGTSNNGNPSSHLAPVAQMPMPAAQRISHPILAGKTVGIVGFSEEQRAELGHRLAAQYCSFLTMSHEEAEFRKGAAASCDLLIIEARDEWAAEDALYPANLFRVRKPALLVGSREILSRVSSWTHGGVREPVTAPWETEDAIWRAAMLLSRTPAPKVRKGHRRNTTKRVLIGDADTSVSALLSAFLTQEGMECHVADNGVATLTLAKTKEADAVVIDASMPGLDGFELLAAIKRDPSMQHVAVVMLTSRQSEADTLRAFGLGADDYLVKPFSPMEVAARIKRLLARVAA